MKYTTIKNTTLRINHRRRERSNRKNRIDKVSQKIRDCSSFYSVLIFPGAWWHADQQLLHVFRVLFSRLLSWVCSRDPLGYSWWPQLPAAAWADHSLSTTARPGASPEEQRPAVLKQVFFFLTSCPQVVFSTYKLCSVSFAWKVYFLLLLPLHLLLTISITSMVVILPCSIKPVGGIAQETDLEL